MNEIGFFVSTITFAPVIVAVMLALLTALARSFDRDLPDELWRGVGIGVALFCAVLAFWMWLEFDPASARPFQFVEVVPWLPALGLQYFVGIDGISLLLICATTFLMVLVLVASWYDVARNTRAYVFLMLALETGLVGSFAAISLFQFFVFWELTLLVLVFIIAIWGSTGRRSSAVRWVLVSSVGSALMWVGVLALHQLHAEQFGVPSLDLVPAPGAVTGLIDVVIPAGGAEAGWRSQRWLFALFVLAFAIKMPWIPFHTASMDALSKAPTGAAVVVTVLAMPLSMYGLVRFVMPLFPVAAVEFSGWISGAAAIGIVYAAAVGIAQVDFKRVALFIAMAHLGFIALGLFAFNVPGLEGGLIHIVARGGIAAGLLLLAGMLEQRRGTRALADFGGIAKPMPVFAFFFAVVALAGAGVPLLSGFVGEFLVLFGAFEAGAVWAVVAAVGAAGVGIAVFRTFSRVALGRVENPQNRGLIDLTWLERGVMLAVAVPLIWIGVQPEVLTSRLHQPVLKLRREMLERAHETERSYPDPTARRAIERLALHHAPVAEIAARAPVEVREGGDAR